VKIAVKTIKPKKNMNKISRHLNLIGNVLIVISLIGLFLTFGPALSLEGDYQVRKVLKQNYIVNEYKDVNTPKTSNELVPPNLDFSIVIPEIGAVAPVYTNVDPFNEKEFQEVLKHGVAQAKGSVLPGQSGNTYIFAHSTDAFYNVGRYNAVFYLIGKLQPGDDIYIYFQNHKYAYKVYDKKVVSPTDIGYIGTLKKNVNTLTLQTCYPPGTTLKRLVVLAELTIIK
jgi:sortase A